MDDKTNAVYYNRRGSMKKAIIYMRGERQIEQKLLCLIYAGKKDYHILYETNNINNIGDCDVLIVANASRLSRSKEEYCEIVKDFKKRGIRIEVAVTDENAGEYLEMLSMLSTRYK